MSLCFFAGGYISRGGVNFSKDLRGLLIKGGGGLRDLEFFEGA